jgi:hypothetical protein
MSLRITIWGGRENKQLRFGIHNPTQKRFQHIQSAAARGEVKNTLQLAIYGGLRSNTRVVHDLRHGLGLAHHDLCGFFFDAFFFDFFESFGIVMIDNNRPSSSPHLSLPWTFIDPQSNYTSSN